ncbi:MAG: T9SS type A sorting domain-containing protein [Planctomycetes bacterium]|nr:T9SS type A sorting domain-containing protein [Planctomycetota bacterium]
MKRERVSVGSESLCRLLLAACLFVFVGAVSAQNVLQNSGFGTEDNWSVYQLATSTEAYYDFNATFAGPTYGDGPCLNVWGDTDAHILFFQQVTLESGAIYKIDGGAMDFGLDDLSCNWFQIYISEEEPVEGQDYTPIGDTHSDRHLGFESWAEGGAYTGDEIDGTFDEDMYRYYPNYDSLFVVAPGEFGGTVDVYFAMKIGSCGPSFDWLIDDVTLTRIGDPIETPSENEQLVNGFFGSDEAWTVYQLTDAAVASADFNYTDDGPAAGDGPALNLTGEVDAHVLIFQQVELIAGATYAISGGFKDISGVDLDCNWCQIYISPEAPIEGQDYTPIGDTNSDRYLGFDSWEGGGAYSGTGLDGTFEDDAYRYGHEANLYIPPGTPGESVEVYFALKSGSCGPTFNLLFDSLSLLLIDLPFPDETEMIANGSFGSDAGWFTVKLADIAAPDASADFNYTDDGPGTGEGPALRVSGDIDSHTLIYQPVTLLRGITYNISGAFKDVSDWELTCNWCQIYVSGETPVEGQDYTPDTERYLGFDSWSGDGAYAGSGLDGTFEEDAYRYLTDSTFVLVPGPLGEEYDVFFGLKIGSCGPAYDHLLDNLSLNYMGVPVSIEEEETSAIPEKFILNQNYPNPFNPTTTISFRLAKVENVKLTIYDIMGRKVRTLLNNRLNQGTHLIVWDGRGNSSQVVASGVYFYTLSVDDRTVAKRMTLLK